MNHNRDHYRSRGRGCARNSDSFRLYGGAATSGFTVAPEPLLPERPDLPVYVPDNSCAAVSHTGGRRRTQRTQRSRRSRTTGRSLRKQRGSGYGVDVTDMIAGMPVYHSETSSCGLQRGGASDPRVYDASVAGYTFEPSNAAESSAGVPFNEVVSQPGRACASVGPTDMSGAATRSVGGALRLRRNRAATIRFRRRHFNTSRRASSYKPKTGRTSRRATRRKTHRR